MASINKIVTDIDGLIPALDRRKILKPFVVSGDNFTVDVNGPRTGFGTKFITPQKVKTPAHAQAFEMLDETYYFFGTGIFKLGEPSLIFHLVHDFGGDISASPHRWTHAKVDGYEYFCHPAVGLIYYDPATKYFQAHPSATIPATPTAICVAGGRLIVLGAFAYAWSALDDGLDMTPALATGAGQQALSILGGDPIAVESLKAGFMVFTTEGSIVATFNGQLTVFTHQISTFDYTPINSYAIVTRHAGEILILTVDGLYRTTGGTPEPWLPLFSEFLREELKSYDFADPSIIRFDYIEGVHQLAVSFGTVASEAYTHAYMVHETTERVGKFSHGHYGFMNILLQEGAEAGEHFAYIGANKFLHRVVAIPRREIYPSAGTEYYHKAAQEFQVRYTGSAYIMPSVMRMGAVSEASLVNGDVTQLATQSLTIYPEPFAETAQFPDTVASELGEDWNNGSGSEDWSLDVGSIDWNAIADVYMPQTMSMRDDLIHQLWFESVEAYQPLMANVEIGMFRYSPASGPEYPDAVTLVTDLKISTASTGTLADEFEDWNAIADGASDEDWTVLTAIEDWGYGILSASDYGISVIATNDGTEVFATTVPSLSRQLQTQRDYTLLSTGVYHTVRLTANLVDQSFHLKELELAGSLAGRL